jgi:hypothetical protein
MAPQPSQNALASPARGSWIAVGVHFGTRAAVGDIKLTDSLIPFHQPIGIDFHTDNLGVDNLTIPSNYPTGEPFNLNGLTRDQDARRVRRRTAWRRLKIATARLNPSCQAFPVGDVFTAPASPARSCASAPMARSTPRPPSIMAIPSPATPV